MNNEKIGHVFALITIVIWDTTFISTKVLLIDFKPIEILFFRFVIGFIALLFVYPYPLKNTTFKQEILFALAGLSGVCLYYLLENIALTYTMASNVGVIISIAPFFTALIAFFMKNEKLQLRFFVGFIVALIGIFLISFNGVRMQLNPQGDILALLATFVWACYSILIRKVSEFGFYTIQTTRRIFGYGLLFMILALFLFDFHIGINRFFDKVNLLNILFLGLGASAFCFVTWNLAVKHLGAVKTSIYIYLVPVITVMTSFLVLKEKITFISAMGTLLTLCGLLISQIDFRKKGEENGYKKMRNNRR